MPRRKAPAVLPDGSAPLAGVRILDLTRVLAGPWSAQFLADLGADVIKVERPGGGDDSRTFGPPYLVGRDGEQTAENAFFLSANRGKRSITLNLANKDAQKIVRSLARNSDVVMENYKVGTLGKYGLDYASLSADHPGLIYCSITGFGQSGPYSHRPGYDAVFQGMGGLMSVTGPEDGAPGAGPVKVGPSIVDIVAGLFASNGITAALFQRTRNGGRGQHVDIALLDSVVAAMSHYAQIYLVSGVAPPRRGTAGNGGIPSQMFNCSDGAIMLTAGNDAQFARLCGVLERPDLVADPRFATNNARVANRREITTMLDTLFRANTVDHWLARLEAADVPSGPINDLRGVFDDPQVRQRGMRMSLPHPLSPDLRVVGCPVKLSGSSTGATRPPPLIGEHTEEILREELGLDAASIAALRENGAC